MKMRPSALAYEAHSLAVISRPRPDGRPEAARHCPFASRLVVELRASGAIALRYNGAVARTFPGGVTEWEAAYAAALAADVPGLCAADAA